MTFNRKKQWKTNNGGIGADYVTFVSSNSPWTKMGLLGEFHLASMAVGHHLV